MLCLGVNLVACSFVCALFCVASSDPVYSPIFRLLPLAKFSTPDALAGFFALLSLYLFLRRSRLVYVLVVLMPLIRTDLVILSLLITGYIFVTQKNYYSLIVGFCSLITYFGVNMIMGNYGYLVLFNFTFIGLDPYPRDMKLSIQPWEYVRPYIECVKEFIHHPHLLAYVVVSYLLFAKQTYKKVRSDLLSVIVISGSYVFLHVALFPHYEERFVAFPVSVMCVALFAIPLQNAALSPSALAMPSRRLGIDRFFLRPKNAA
jgi:hypothetical protein